MTPLRMRLKYQGRRRTPCDWWFHASAATRLSATSAASAHGTATDWRIAPTNVRSASVVTGVSRAVVMS
jgi:hypothetical protein